MLVGCVTDPNEIDEISFLVDLIELRLDHFEMQKRPKYPCIFTWRRKDQGGARDIEESQRLISIEKYLELGPDYCDIETDTDPHFIQKMAQKFPKVKLIGSYHNFEETPKDLNALLKKNPHFSIYKFALKANSTADMLRLMLWARNQEVPVSVMSLGEFGKPSRVLAPIMGSVLNYAGLKEDLSLHRYSLETLLTVFHYRKLNKMTQIYALIGDPVEKSPGHIFHNLHFNKNAVYVKMIVRPDEVAEVFSLMKQLPFGGLSVTIPLKEKVQVIMDTIKMTAQSIGAINTVTFENGQTIGSNTDGNGALNALEKHIFVKNKRLAVLGAGGTARAIVYEAMRRGAKVSIFNRTKKKAEKLAQEFSCEGFGLDALHHFSYDILINTIPPTSKEIPEIKPNTVVMDVVIVPKKTPLLEKAEKRGCRCVYGEEMFVEQALLQQKEWSSLSA